MNREHIALSIFAALFLALLCWLISNPAAAQVQSPEQRHALCGPRRQVLDAYKATHKQAEQWIGNAGADGVLVILADREGNWSLFVVQPDVACLLGAGDRSTPMFGEPA
jgi:hypothetical protein